MLITINTGIESGHNRTIVKAPIETQTHKHIFHKANMQMSSLCG